MAQFSQLHMPMLKWLVGCLVATIVILCLAGQRADTEYLEYRLPKVLSTAESIIEASDSSVSDSETDAVPPRFFVETAKCRIPYVDPFEEDAMAIFHADPFETCSNESALVAPIYDLNRQRYVLLINETLAASLLNSSTGSTIAIIRR